MGTLILTSLLKDLVSSPRTSPFVFVLLFGGPFVFYQPGKEMIYFCCPDSSLCLAWDVGSPQRGLFHAVALFEACPRR